MAAATGNKREVVQFTSYSRKLRDNIKSITDNYGEILKAAKVQNTIISIVVIMNSFLHFFVD